MTETVHPALEGRRPEAEALATLVRRLMLATVTHAADATTTAEVADAVHRLADELDGLDAPALSSRYGVSSDGGYDPVHLFCFDYVFGTFNPLALPVVPRWDDPMAVADATFTPLYEGPPDGVHGAILAAAFDQMCNVANVGAGVAGFTTELEVRYRTLTRIGRPVRFEAEVAAVEGHSVTTRARALQEGAVTADATGVFSIIPERRQA